MAPLFTLSLALNLAKTLSSGFWDAVAERGAEGDQWLDTEEW
jgi:hypothetical protein